MKKTKRALAVVAASAALGLAAPGLAQEVKQKPATVGTATPKSINVTQDQLTKAGASSSNWLHTNGNYAQTR